MFKRATSPRKQRIPQVLTGTLLALVSIGVTLLALELGTRFLPPPYPVESGRIFQCDETLGWTGAPNFEGVFEDPNFRQALHFNALGMHDTKHPFDKTPDTVRILMLGDSFVHAVQVDEASTAHQVLEERLNEQTSSSRVEVISSGVVNWGTNQELIFYRVDGRRFQADLVLLMFYIGNDLLDNLPGNALTSNGFNCYAPYFALCEGQLAAAPLTYAPGVSRLDQNCSPARRVLINGLGRLYQHSRLYQQLEPLIRTNRPRQQFGQAYASPYSALYFTTDEAELEQAWQITQATLAQLRQEVEADGAQFAVALISPEIVVRLARLSPAEQEAFLQTNPIFAEAQIDRPNQRLADFLNGQAIPFIDLTGPMIDHLAATGLPLYLVGEGHWTAEGNRVAGETLSHWLLENDFPASGVTSD